MGLEQFFGVLTAVDCTESLWLIGSLMFIVGAFVSAVVIHVLAVWK